MRIFGSVTPPPDPEDKTLIKLINSSPAKENSHEGGKLLIENAKKSQSYLVKREKE